MQSFRTVQIVASLIGFVGLANLHDARAADATIVGVLSIASEPNVATELSLSDDVHEKLAKLIDRREADALELSYQIKDLPAAERDARLRSFREESEILGLNLLSQVQRQRLEQLRLARSGLAALAETQISEKLKIKVDQRDVIVDLIRQRDDALLKTSGNGAQAIRAEFERKLAAVLTSAQRNTWLQITGAPVGAGETATTFAVEKSAEKSPVSGAPDLPKTPLPVTAKSSGGPSDEYRFNFHHQPWKDVLEWLAEQAELSLVIDAPPPGTFNYFDTRAYKLPEVIDIINGVLLPKGYTLVRKDRMLTLVNFQGGAIPTALIPTVSLEELQQRGKNEIVSTVFAVHSLSTDEAERVVDRMADKAYGKVLVLPQARQIEVTETAGRLRTIQQVLERADGPAALGRDDLRPFELKYAAPYEVLATIKQLMGIPTDRNATEDGSLRVVIDAAGRRLLATGKPDKLARVDEIIQMLDVEGRGNNSASYEQPQFETYAISSADSATALKVLQTLMAGLPDVRLDIDPKTGNVYAYARPSQHATIRATLDQLQRDGKRLEVIQLRNVDPATAQTAVTKLFQADGDSSPLAPKVEADSGLRQLLVRGTEAQITQIREMVDKMEGREIAKDEGDRGKMRIIPLTGRQAQAAIEAMQQIWVARHGNKIRIVTPSNSIQEIKPTNDAPPQSSSPEQARSFEIPLVPSTADRTMPANLDAGSSNTVPPRETGPDKETRRIVPGHRPESAPSISTPSAGAPSKPDGKADRSTYLFPAKFPSVRVFFASQPTEISEQNAADREGAARTAHDEKVVINSESTEKSSSGSVRGAPIVVVPGPGGLLITSDDKEALDEFEKLITALASRQISGAPKYTVFYCKYAKAPAVAETLKQILAGGVTRGGGGSDLVGDIAGNMFGDFAGGLIGNMLGGSESSEPTTVRSKNGPIEIIPDSRLNALFVNASPTDLETIEQLWKILDQQNSPEDIAVTPAPRLIPVQFTSAKTVADVVQQVYQDRMVTAPSQRQPSPQEFLQALRGGGRRGSRGGQSQQEQEQLPKMSIGVDERNNAIVVAASDPLFNEVKSLVAQLDRPSDASRETTKVVTLKRTNADSVKAALVSILGEQAQTASAGAPSARANNSRDRNRWSDSSARSERGGDNQRQFPAFMPGGGFDRGGFGGFGRSGFNGSRSGRGSSFRGGRGGGG
ncbi:MAG: hypothetical protein IT427_20235 [Pirellulales bacterium]|nr:hypothetical protein [Pirellulales bacterium]